MTLAVTEGGSFQEHPLHAEDTTRLTVMTIPANQPPHHFNINMPADRVAGHYADFAAIWHTPETFVMDFIASAQPTQPDPNVPGGLVTNSEVVTRVRIPAAQVWEIMKALEQQYSAWEIETGKRPPNDQPGLPQ